MCHELKCLPKYFEPLLKGIKTFEVRKNDRPFKVGDILAINEYIPESVDPYEDIERRKTDDWREVDGGFYTGRCVLRKITYILDNAEFCAEGMVILGFIGSSEQVGINNTYKTVTTITGENPYGVATTLLSSGKR